MTASLVIKVNVLPSGYLAVAVFMAASLGYLVDHGGDV